MYFAVSFFLVPPSSNPLSDSTTRHWLTDTSTNFLNTPKCENTSCCKILYCMELNLCLPISISQMSWWWRFCAVCLWKTLSKRYVMSHSYSWRLLVALFVFFATDSSLFEPRFLCFARKGSHWKMLRFRILDKENEERDSQKSKSYQRRQRKLQQLVCQKTFDTVE